MTEIPEHLLKRSQERRGAAPAAPPAASAAEASTAVESGSTSTSKPGRVATPDPVGPPPPKPDSPVVSAYKARKKIPMWAMATLSILPLWAFMYVRALQPETAVAEGPLGAGASVYNSCAACHGGAGEGGVGYSFQNGAVIATFPHIEDQLRWVALGSEAYVAAGIEVAGDPNRVGGPHISGATGVMPAGTAALGLTDAEVLAAVCHERYDLGGAPTEGVEYETWCSPESEIYLALEAGTATFADLHEQFEGVLPIGTVPVAGSPAAT